MNPKLVASTVILFLLISGGVTAADAGAENEIRRDIPDAIPPIALDLVPQQTINVHITNVSDQMAEQLPAQTISVTGPKDGQVIMSPDAADSPTLEINITQQAITTLQSMEAAPGDDEFYTTLQTLLEDNEIEYRAHTLSTRIATDLIEVLIQVQTS